MMAEKGTLIVDQVGGESIATREAIELDDAGNPRVIQRVDITCGKIETTWGTPIRTLNDGAVDDIQTSAWPAEVTANAIVIGDKSNLVVGGLSHCAAGPFSPFSVSILPVILDDVNNIQGFLTKQSLTCDLTNYAGAYDGPAYLQYLNLASFDTKGAGKIGIAITTYSNIASFTTGDYIKIWAWPI